MKKTMRWLLVTGAVAALGACSDEAWEYTPASGTITYLEYEPGYFTQDCGYDFDYDGRYRYGCDSVWEPECYLVEFSDDDYDYWDCTDPAMWELLEVGMPYVEGQTELQAAIPSADIEATIAK